MTLRRTYYLYIEFRRIVGIILLFTFFTVAALAQKPDLTNQSGKDSISLSSGSQLKREPAMAKPLSGNPVDSLNTEELIITAKSDTIPAKEQLMEHSARKAMIYSIILPGLGQAYNKKYFKIPIVYAALGGAGYLIYYNTTGYRQAFDNYALDPTDVTSERILRAWRRNLEISYIVLVVVDALQIVDAYVDANLFYWDVSPDLSIRVEPAIDPVWNPSGVAVNNYGLRCRITF